jgi:hypothetical protein
MIFAHPPAAAEPLRHRLRAAYRADEAATIDSLLPAADLPHDMLDRIAARARSLVREVRRFLDERLYPKPDGYGKAVGW